MLLSSRVRGRAREISRRPIALINDARLEYDSAAFHALPDAFQRFALFSKQARQFPSGNQNHLKIWFASVEWDDAGGFEANG